MELTVTRRKFTTHCTMDDVAINGVDTCKVLEDLDRGLTSNMPLDEIKKLKVFAKTAIPTGRYKVTRLYWGRFGKWYPHIEAVPGYDGILIHGGITDSDTEGCLLCGMSFPKDDMLIGQPQARQLLIDAIFAALDKGEEVWITIVRDADAWNEFKAAA